MKRILFIVTGLTLLAVSMSARADNQSHYKAAERFYNTTNVTDVDATTNQIVSAMMSQSPELAPHRSVLLEFMLEIINSKEYRDLKIRSYMKHLSEQQLVELTRLFSSDAYQHFRARQAAMLKESNYGIQQLMRSRQGDLVRRIEENKRNKTH